MQIPAREVPKDGILQDVRLVIRRDLHKGKTLMEIQSFLETKYPGKDFGVFFAIWRRFHPERKTPILRESYKRHMVKTADTDKNWRV